MFEKLAKLYRLYMIRAKANNFPISEYGLLGEKCKRKEQSDD